MRSRSCSRRRRRCRIFCASAWSFQKSGADALASSWVSSCSGRAASKIAPQIGGTLAEILIASQQLVRCWHDQYCTRRHDARRQSTQSTQSTQSFLVLVSASSALYVVSTRYQQQRRREDDRRVRE